MDGDCGDIAGDCDTHMGANAPQPTRGSDTRKRRWTKQLAGIHEGRFVGERCCVCLEGQELDKSWRGEKLHKRCWNGVRCYLRLLTSKAQKDGEMGMFRRRREQWREKVLPLVVPDGLLRPASVRQGAADVDDAPPDDEVVERITEKLLLPRQAYKIHKKMWEGWATDEASSEFEKELENQTDEELDTEGNPRVRVAGPERIRTTTRFRRNASSGSTAARPRPRSPSSSRNARRLSSSPSMPRSAVTRASSRRRRRSRSRASTARSVTTPKAGKTPGHNRGGQPHGSPTSTSQDLDKKMSFVEFLTEKRRLREEVERVAAAARMKSSVLGRLQVAIPKLTSKQREELVGSPEETLKSMEGAIAKIDEYRIDLDKMQPLNLTDFLQRFRTLQDELQTKKDESEEYYAGLKFILTSGAADQRKEKLASNHQRKTMATKLMAGSFGRNFAKLVAANLTNVDEAGSTNAAIDTDKTLKEFSPARISVWTTTTDVGKQVIKQFEEPIVLTWGVQLLSGRAGALLFLVSVSSPRPHVLKFPRGVIRESGSPGEDALAHTCAHLPWASV